jgi:hypothetical protein
MWVLGGDPGHVEELVRKVGARFRTATKSGGRNFRTSAKICRGVEGSELTSKKMHTFIPVFQICLLPCSRIGFFSNLPRKGGKRVKT